VAEVARKAEPVRQADDVSLLEDAFARFQPELLGTLYYIVGNLEDARDALQDSFLKCWRHREEVSEVQNLKAWIFRIALNTGRDLRQTAWRRKRQGLPEDENMLVGRDQSPHVEVEHRERLERVRGALRDLRNEEQEVFLLRQNGGLSYEEIAEAAGIPLGTVKTRMRLAITKLRAALADPQIG
jgi:RNA polymerase sigma factor (sigma-70 family)